MKIILTRTLLLAVLLTSGISNAVFAAEALCDNCKITIVQPDSAVPGVLIYANVNSAWTTGGDCSSTSSQRRMYILEGTPMFNEIYSAALAAISADITVDIKGTGTCVSGIETVRFIKLEK